MFNELCPNPVFSKPRKKRKKIWELDPSFHCPIVGTCFTINELRRLHERVNKKINNYDLTDHEIHVSFACSVTDSSYPTRLLDKTLNKKYKRTVTHFQKAEDSEKLGKLWDEAVEQGDIAGAFWSLMTHPLATDLLIRRVYGEVHMLSHLAGASTRIDLRHLKSLKVQCKNLQQDLNKANKKASRLSHEHQETFRMFNQQQTYTRQTELKLKTTEKTLEKWENGERINLLQKHNAMLEQQLVSEKSRMKKEVENHTQMLNQRDSEIAELKAYLAHVQCNNPALNENKKTDNTSNAEKENNRLGLRITVEGRNILYVGGISKLTPHMRAFVESNGGKFLHHDGGLDDSATRLNGLLEQADTVLCPLDCISHNACHKVKRFCKQYAKPMVMLRKPSLSSFVKGLQDTSSQN